MKDTALANECLKALEYVSGVNHYSVTYFQWQAQHDMAVAVFVEACHQLRLSDNDPASRAEKYDEYTDAMDRCIIDATDEHYPMGENGIRIDRDAETPAVFQPKVVVSNDTPNDIPQEVPSTEGDGGTTIVEAAATDQPAEPIAAAG